MSQEGRCKKYGKYVKYDDTTKKKDAGKLGTYISEEKLRTFRKLAWAI